MTSPCDRPLRFLVQGCLCVISLVLVGCGPPKGTVKGQVTLDGKTLKGGMVNFLNQSGGRSSTAEIGEDGRYSAEILGGDFVVTVDTKYLKPSTSGSQSDRMQSNGMRGGSSSAGMGGSGPPPAAGKIKDAPVSKSELPGNPADYGYKQSNPSDAAKKFTQIPDRYTDVEKSNLKYNFPGGDQVYDIPLTAK